MSKIIKYSRLRRHKRIRAKISGNAKIPRLFVFRSAKHIYVQLVDDENGKTLLSASSKLLERGAKGEMKTKSSASDRELKGKKKQTKIERARETGKLIAKKAIAQKIEKVVFDRGGYKYHGRVKALAEGAREGGLKF